MVLYAQENYVSTTKLTCICMARQFNNQNEG